MRKNFKTNFYIYFLISFFAIQFFVLSILVRYFYEKILNILMYANALTFLAATLFFKKYFLLIVFAVIFFIIPAFSFSPFSDEFDSEKIVNVKQFTEKYFSGNVYLIKYKAGDFLLTGLGTDEIPWCLGKYKNIHGYECRKFYNSAISFNK